MIHVERVLEPPDFDERVRQPGLSELAVMTGQTGWVTRRGPKRKQLTIGGAPITRIEDIPADELPDYWTRALPDLCNKYRRICAYVCVYIERVTGAATADHWVPKSRDPRQAYEWENLRLACSIMNSRKATETELIDPFFVEEGWFALDFIDWEVVPGVGPEHPKFAAIDDTISPRGLDLNCYECRSLREEYVASYREGEITLGYLDRRAPFIARELRRQGLLRQA
jgi:hypothetical protein